MKCILFLILLKKSVRKGSLKKNSYHWKKQSKCERESKSFCPKQRNLMMSFLFFFSSSLILKTKTTNYFILDLWRVNVEVEINVEMLSHENIPSVFSCVSFWKTTLELVDHSQFKYIHTHEHNTDRIACSMPLEFCCSVTTIIVCVCVHIVVHIMDILPFSKWF